MSFYVTECVLDYSAIAEPLTVQPLVQFIFILVNKTLSGNKIKRHTGGGFQRNVLKRARREYKKEQT